MAKLLPKQKTRTKIVGDFDWKERISFPNLSSSPREHPSIASSDYRSSNPLTNKYCLPYLVTSSKTNDLIWWFIDSISLLLLPDDILLLISHPMTWCLVVPLRWWMHRGWRKHNRNNNAVMTKRRFCSVLSETGMKYGIYTNNDNVVLTAYFDFLIYSRAMAF